MSNRLLLGFWRMVFSLPQSLWEGQLAKVSREAAANLAFMSSDHHRVRDYVVRELPGLGRPIPPDLLSRALDLPLERVQEILDELERGMTFLFRNERGEVTWAYPVTVDRTPHRVSFSTGEQVYAAWAIDAIAVPFVQGQLRGEPLSFVVDSTCAHCGRPLHLEIDSELHYRVQEEDADPRVFVPLVDFEKLEDPSIIDAFWQNSVFFWSEEHAREYRRQNAGVRGIYVTLDQAVYMTPLTQGPLFAFPRQAGGERWCKLLFWD